MHDPVDIRRRIDRLVARIDRRDDYGQLLASGQVIHELEDGDEVEAWRAEIRRQARADKIKVRTGFNDGIVWALRVRSPHADALAAGVRYRDLLRRTARLAVELRHEPSIAVWDGDEVVCGCDRCSAIGYGDTAEDLVGGALFEDKCPDEEPPALTALAMMHVPRSRRSDTAEVSHRRVRHGRGAAWGREYFRVASISIQDGAWSGCGATAALSQSRRLTAYRCWSSFAGAGGAYPQTLAATDCGTL